MKKKVVVFVFTILFIVLVIWLLFCCFRNNSYNVYIKKDKDTFEYELIEAFSGNEWELYINKFYVYSIAPFEGCSEKEMKKHLSKAELIRCFYDNENIRIYGLPLEQYKSKYEIVYTLNDFEFHSLNKDAEKYAEDPDIKQRLDQLYEKYPYAELIKREQESWE